MFSFDLGAVIELLRELFSVYLVSLRVIVKDVKICTGYGNERGAIHRASH